MNLDQFIETAKTQHRLRMHIFEPGFSTLYVRYTKRWIQGVAYYPVLDLASLEVEEKNRGAFTKLFNRIRSEYPALPLYVENVLTFRFGEKLESLGFVNVGPEICPCYFLKPQGSDCAHMILERKKPEEGCLT